jgi:O-antigen/teichoic acid export membrane protein
MPQALPGVPLILLLITLLSLPFRLGSQLFQNLLLGLQAVRAYNGIELLSGGLGLGVIVGLLAFRVLDVASLVIVSSILAVVVCVLAVRAVGARASLSWTLDWGMLRAGVGYGIIFFVNNLLAFLLLKSDFFLVNHFLGTGSVGIYSVAVQISDVLLLVPTTLGTLLFPRLSATEDSIERTHTCLQFARLTAGGMGLLCALAGFLSPVLIPILFGASFYPAWKPLALLLPGIWLLALENVLVMYLAATRLPLWIPGLWLVGLSLNVGLNVWLLPHFGLTAAAMTSSLAYAIVAIGIFSLFRRETGANLGDILVPRRLDLVKVMVHLQGRRNESASTALVAGVAGARECSGPEASRAKPLGPV